MNGEHEIVVMTDDSAGTREMHVVVYCRDCMKFLIERPETDGAISMTEINEAIARHEQEEGTS